MRLPPPSPPCRRAGLRSCGTLSPSTSFCTDTSSTSVRISSVDNDGSRRPCSRKPTCVRWRRCAYRANGFARFGQNHTILGMKSFAGPIALAALLTLAAGCGGSTGPRPFLPRGIDALTQGRVPHGPTFAISALRYRFQGRLSSDLQAQMEPHESPAAHREASHRVRANLSNGPLSRAVRERPVGRSSTACCATPTIGARCSSTPSAIA